MSSCCMVMLAVAFMQRTRDRWCHSNLFSLNTTCVCWLIWLYQFRCVNVSVCSIGTAHMPISVPAGLVQHLWHVTLPPCPCTCLPVRLPVCMHPCLCQVYPMYKAFIEPDLKMAHIRIVNKFNPFSGFQEPFYILKVTTIRK